MPRIPKIKTIEDERLELLMMEQYPDRRERSNNGNLYICHIYNFAVIFPSKYGDGWTYVISDVRKSRKGAKRYAKELYPTEDAAYWAAYEETH